MAPKSDLQTNGVAGKVSNYDGFYYSQIYKYKEKKSKQQLERTTAIDDEELSTHETIVKPVHGDGLDSSPGYQFSTAKKNFILIQITLAFALVVLTQSTQLPAMPLMQEGFNTTPTTVNAAVSIGAYMYGIFPAIWATYGDGYGRRWIYIISLLIAVLGNVGTALSTNIPMLFVFRVVSAAGGSSLLSTGAGTLADVFPAAERGRAIALYAAVPFLVPTFGPVLGGAIVEHFGWRGLFWALAIVAFTIWLMLLFFLPETRPPASSSTTTLTLRQKLLVNPFASLKLLLFPNVFMVSLYSGVITFVANSIETSFSWVYSKQYGLNATIVGACFLPSAFGALIGCVGTGLLSDRRFKRNQAVCQKTNVIYYPEMRLSYDILLVSIVCAVSGYATYGWLVQVNASYAFGMIAVSFGRFGALVLACITTVYLTDSFHKKGASVSACLDVFRNMIGATGTLTPLEMQKAMGAGLYATTCAVFLFAFSAVLPLTIMYAAKWKRMRDKQ